MSTSLQVALAADTHLADGQFMSEERTQDSEKFTKLRVAITSHQA